MAPIISYVLVLIAFTSVVTLVSSDANDYNNVVLVKTKGLAKKIDSKSSENDKKKGYRKRRDVSASDKVDIVKTINDLRRTVNASDMPYLNYNAQLESDLAKWTKECNLDAILTVTGDYTASYIKGGSLYKSNFTVNITQDFNDTRFSTMMKSVYITGVAFYETFCTLAKGEYYSYHENVYISAVGFVTQSNFDQNVPQYSIGEACTTCLSGVYWCDSGLCRGDCSPSNSSCTCEATCSDVNNVTCTCPKPDGNDPYRKIGLFYSDASPVVSKWIFSVFLAVLAAIVL